MSYILDALSKANQEARQQELPQLETQHNYPNRNRQPLGLWLVLVLIAMNAVALFWYLQSTRAGTTEAATLTTMPTQNSSASTNTKLQGERSPDYPPLVESTPTAELVIREPVSIARLPQRVQQQIPDIAFSSHIYADDPSLRMVGINGVNRYEGDLIADDLVLEEITEEGIVMSLGNYAFTMSVLRDWSYSGRQ